MELMKTVVKSRQDVRDYLNKRVGSLITTQDFSKPSFTANYLGVLLENNFVERVSRGEYKILKKIKLKKRGVQKGKRTNVRIKDLSIIPSILNSSKDGLVMRQIQAIYENITPKEKQVVSLYLYRLLKFAKRQGVVVENGRNEKLRINDRGPYPKKLILTNPYISIKEWKKLVSDYRLYYQYKKEHKIKRKTNPKTIMEKFKDSDSIIQNFDENRDNPNKQYIEDFFIQKVKTRLGDELVRCLIVTGPDYNHHMDSLFTTFAEKVMVCEIAPDVFDTIYRKAQICPYHIDHRVSLLECDINDIAAVNCRYADIDLMRTLKNNYNIIRNQITRQDLLCKKSKEKFLTFTCTRRNRESFETTISYLKKLVDECFGMKLTGLSDGIEIRHENEKLRSCKSHFPKIEKYGRVNKMYVFTYQDDVPMMNALFTYK